MLLSCIVTRKYRIRIPTNYILIELLAQELCNKLISVMIKLQIVGLVWKYYFPSPQPRIPNADPGSGSRSLILIFMVPTYYSCCLPGARVLDVCKGFHF